MQSPSMLTYEAWSSVHISRNLYFFNCLQLMPDAQPQLGTMDLVYFFTEKGIAIFLL